MACSAEPPRFLDKAGLSGRANIYHNTNYRSGAYIEKAFPHYTIGLSRKPILICCFLAVEKSYYLSEINE